MPRAPRSPSPLNLYHVTVRGIGRRCLFESDEDRLRFLSRLVFQKKRIPGFSVLAWCLMDNHAHLLVGASLDELKSAMRSLCTAYANYFNAAHGHVGAVFQGRYGSIPVESERHFLAAIRYIHLNPLEAGCEDVSLYRWSSYRQYLGASGVCDTALFSSYFDSVDDIRAYHRSSGEVNSLERIDGYRRRIPDGEALALAKRHLGEAFAETVPNLPKRQRDEAIAKLYALGLSGHQIERLTGIGRGIVQRVRCTALQR